MARNQFSTNTHSPAVPGNNTRPFKSPNRFGLNGYENKANPLSFNKNFNQRRNFGNMTMRERNNNTATEGNLFNNLTYGGGRNGLGMGNAGYSRPNVNMNPRRRTISPMIHKRLDFDEYERNLLSNRRYKNDTMNPRRYMFERQNSVQSLMSQQYSEDDYTLEEDEDYTDDSSFVTDESEEDHGNMSVFSRRGNGMMNPGRYSPQRPTRIDYAKPLSPVNYNDRGNRAMPGYLNGGASPRAKRKFKFSPKRKKSKSKLKMSPRRNVDVNEYVKKSQYVPNGLNINHVDGNSYRPAYNAISENDFYEQNNLNYGAKNRKSYNNLASKALNYATNSRKIKQKSPKRMVNLDNYVKNSPPRRYEQKNTTRNFGTNQPHPQQQQNNFKNLPRKINVNYANKTGQNTPNYNTNQKYHQNTPTYGTNEPQHPNPSNYGTNQPQQQNMPNTQPYPLQSKPLNQNGHKGNLNYGYSSYIQNNQHIYSGKTFYEKIFKKQLLSMSSPAWKDYVKNSKEEISTVKNVQKIIKGQRFTGDKVYLPGSHDGITLLLDLDETLIHSEERKPGVEYDAHIELKNPDGRVERIGVMIRPYAKEFLERMSQKFEVVVFTAAKQEYAEKVVEHLDPQKKFISGSFYRQNCSKAYQFHIKDFRVIGNRKPQNLILVDNLLYSFAANFENGIPIKPYIKGKDDWELMYLADVLTKLNNGDNIPKFLIENMKLYHFYEILAE